jgi:starch phosphorylase
MKFVHPYKISKKYKRKAAYFCMEFAVDQSLKIYSGGLGYLAGSHMRSAFQLRQSMVGIGILWKYGYYDQGRQQDQSMDVRFIEKEYHFLEDPGIKFEIQVNNHPVHVKAYYLHPDTFGTAPIYLLTTDIPENDYLARTISHRLYDSNISTKIAQYILLGKGGAKLLKLVGYTPDVYHLNEAHGLPAAFQLLGDLKDLSKLKEKLVITTHTPIPAGNEVHPTELLDSMNFFGDLTIDQLKDFGLVNGEHFNLTLGALRMSRISNGVSRLHGAVARDMWAHQERTCPITHITNSQNAAYWADKPMYDCLEADENNKLDKRKKYLKKKLFDVVADQCGKRFDPDVLTLVWARRYASYKRPDLITKNLERFEKLVKDTDHPVQIIWAGKPYPSDYMMIDVFNKLVHMSKPYANCAVLTGYELTQSKLLKGGADVWLNTPRICKEASGTSGMTAAMHGTINFSIPDGWIPEFAKNGHNSFITQPADPDAPVYEQDWHDMNQLYELLFDKIIPLYYKHHEQWVEIMKNCMREVIPAFGSDRMADEYYQKLYTPGFKPLDSEKLIRELVGE